IPGFDRDPRSGIVIGLHAHRVLVPAANLHLTGEVVHREPRPLGDSDGFVGVRRAITTRRLTALVLSERCRRSAREEIAGVACEEIAGVACEGIAGVASGFSRKDASGAE